MGKPLFKTSDGDQIDILWEREDVTQGELQQGSETQGVYVTKVRPEAFPNGSPMSVRENFYNVKVNSNLSGGAVILNHVEKLGEVIMRPHVVFRRSRKNS